MPLFVTLVKFTQKGAEQLKGGPGRLEEAKKRAKERGGEIKAFYLTMGQYDAVLISELPSDEEAAIGVLGAASMGFIRTETMRAFSEAEWKKMVAALP
ncbi:MAG: GYD domain-containing protein [bacterium]